MLKRMLVVAGVGLLFASIVACSSEENSMQHDSVLPSNQKNGVSLQEVAPKSNLSGQKQDSSVKNADKQGRKITYKATVSIDVTNYRKSRTTLEGLVKKSNGYMVDSEENQSNKDEQTGEFKYRIPQANFQSFISSLKTISTDAPDISIKGDDVTEEMVDLNSRLKAKKATEARLLTLLNKATESSTLLAISDQLDRTQVEIEEIQGRLQYLNHRIDFSEVTVTLTQDVSVSAPDNESMGQKMKEAFGESSMDIFNGGKNLLIFLAGAIPVLLVLCVLIIPMYLWLRSWRDKKQKQDE